MTTYGFNPVEDYKSRIELQPPMLIQYLQKRESEFLPNIFKLSRDVEHVLNTEIPKTFPSYTLHDINHSIRIMENMFNLINDVEEFDELDVVLLIYAALLHDIGMSASDEEKVQIRNGEYVHSDVNYLAVLAKYYDNDIEAMQDYIRRIHAKRSSIHLKNYYHHYMTIPSHPHANIIDEVALICEAHTEDIYFLKNRLKSYDEKGRYKINPQFCAILLRLADICDCSSQRTPPTLYKLIAPKGVSNQEWRGHFSIENSQVIKTDEKTSQKYIAFFGRCQEANIHRKILSYINWINDEIQHSNFITSQMNEKFKLNIRFPLENRIEPIGYTIPDLKLEVDYVSITNLLMGDNIYGSKSVGLRELIQNSIDACKVRKEMEESALKYGDEVEPLSIRVIIDPYDNKVIIKDNGLGMTMSVISKYFLNIGVSYYRSEDFQLKNLKYVPIGNYGIGFLACFMLSNDVVIKTRHYKSSTKYEVSLTKDSPYICLKEEEDALFRGTEIILNYTEFIQCFNNEHQNVVMFLQEYFITEDIDFKMIDRKSENTEVIANNLKDLKVKNGTVLADVGKYLLGIEGVVSLDIKKRTTNESLDEISYEGSAYFYDGDYLRQIEDVEGFEISKLYYENSIRFISIPLIGIGERDLYDKYYEVLDDVNDTIDRIENKLEWITIFVGKDVDEVLRTQTISDGNYIVGDLSFRDLEVYGHLTEYQTKMYVNVEDMIYRPEKNSYVRFKKAEDSLYNVPSRKIYIRNVLCKGVKLKVTHTISALKINELNLNIIRKDVIPDVSRNKIDVKTDSKLGYAISKAIHMWVYENHPMTTNEKEMLSAFITDYYAEDNEFLIGSL